ncbi:MAG: hypothetical protein RLZZ596_895 [Pseudomonadota bacterium]|jgi:ureidoglycolate lyase
MRFVTFRAASGEAVAGIIRGEQVVDLSHLSCAALLSGTPPSLPTFIEQGLAEWSARLASAHFDEDTIRPLKGLSLLAPLPRPGKIVGAAYNFTDGLAERNMAPPSEPVTFVRLGSTVIGPGEPILVPPDVGQVGYEAELAVVIGRRAIAVKSEKAMDFIAGYTIHNDVSGSGLIKQDQGNFVRGKNLPASAPLGPWLLTPDEISDPYRVGIRLDIDGRLLQDGSTANMLFNIAELIAYISRSMPLEPGDVIATGTPSGVAGMHTPAAWLTPGSTVNIELEGLGRLSNPILAGAPFLEH